MAEPLIVHLNAEPDIPSISSHLKQYLYYSIIVHSLIHVREYYILAGYNSLSLSVNIPESSMYMYMYMYIFLQG